MADYEKKINRMLDRWAFKKKKVKRRQTTQDEIKNRQQSSVEYNGNGTFITEAEKKTPVSKRCEVLVVGGGPAGLSAAISSARAGAQTLIVERYGCFGGVITTVGMETLAWYRYEGTVDSEGVGVEMERLAEKMGGTIKWPYNDSQCLDADYFKIVADQLIKDNKVTPLLHTLVVEVIKDGPFVRGVIVENKSGRQAILADRVVDCTGDADVAYLSGAKFRQTAKKEMMGVTTVFSCSGIDKEKFIRYTKENPRTYEDWGESWNQQTSLKEKKLNSPYLQEEFARARKEGLIPQSATNICGSWSALSDAGEATNLNLIHLSPFDATDVDDLTRAEMEGRRQTLYALKALQHFVPGFEKAKLRNFGMTLGVRDTRKIIGQYDLKEADVMGQYRCHDSVGIFPEFIDGYSILILPTTGRYFQVPYGCLIPKGNVENLVVAGRCVAGDRVSHAAMRNMMACTVTGQGAGVAAAVSIKQNKSFRDIDIAGLHEELRKQKVRID